jgi:hypothetical protein
MSSPADQLASIVPTTVLEGATGWVTKIGKITPEPDKVAVFYDTGGSNPNSRWLLDYRSVQCVVRAPPSEYSTAYDKIQQVRDCLLGITSLTLGSGDRVDGITMMGDIAFINYDDQQRPTFSVNFRVFWEPATNGLTQREPL